MHQRRHGSDECVAVEDHVDGDTGEGKSVDTDTNGVTGAESRDVADQDRLVGEFERDLADDTRLHEALTAPGRYLPPPSVQARPDPRSDSPSPEHPFARRAKLAALVLATAMVIASIVVAAFVTGESDAGAESLRSAPTTSPVSFFTVKQPF
ncbi:hypothetical protein BJF85_14940 [Saccharomonospora sp. CUA-673]|uniref:hypothetical protein n=1 Tax=Saccharomonospora sp. CUA-673 TaxID=1904969 RepID=UPI0009652CFC|nr:hypothetical protein [Saccharomonospora sp. CUA-673]OLT47690.1 hypothetical protein BJF85_14940 [Saccharomonospora sp. CUA-673]